MYSCTRFQSQKTRFLQFFPEKRSNYGLRPVLDDIPVMFICLKTSLRARNRNLAGKIIFYGFFDLFSAVLVYGFGTKNHQF